MVLDDVVSYVTKRVSKDENAALWVSFYIVTHASSNVLRLTMAQRMVNIV